MLGASLPRQKIQFIHTEVPGGDTLFKSSLLAVIRHIPRQQVKRGTGAQTCASDRDGSSAASTVTVGRTMHVHCTVAAAVVGSPSRENIPSRLTNLSTRSCLSCRPRPGTAAHLQSLYNESADDKILVRDVLYDALIWSDQSVLSGVKVDQADGSLFPFIVSSLFVIVDARRKQDQGRAMSYIETFSTSNIPRYLTKWATCQAGADKLGNPITITPEAFLNWLVELEDKGLCSRIKERLVHDEGQNGNQGRISQSDADLFIIDKKSHQEGMDTKGGEDEDVEMGTADSTLMAAAHSMKVMTSGKRKRKDCETEDANLCELQG